MITLKRTTVCLDFDGVIFKRTGRWVGPTVFNGKIIPGAAKAINTMRADLLYRVVVNSARCADDDAIEAIRAYLADHGVEVDDVCATKPRANVYVDDNAVRFGGDWDAAIGDIEATIGRSRRR